MALSEISQTRKDEPCVRSPGESGSQGQEAGWGPGSGGGRGQSVSVRGARRARDCLRDRGDVLGHRRTIRGKTTTAADFVL